MDHGNIDERIEQLNQDLYSLGDDQRRDIFIKRNHIVAEISSLEDLRSRIYMRPTGGIVSILNALLPRERKGFIAVHPLKREFTKLSPKHGTALFALLTSVATYVTLSTLLPWMSVSTGVLAQDFLEVTFGLSSVSTAFIVYSPVIIAMVWHMRLATSPTAWSTGEGIGLLSRFIIRQEHHFRLGAEQWRVRTQIWASVVYGLRFAPFFLPVGALIAMTVYGFVLTRVYIRAFRKSKSVDQAILTSTKVNTTACIWLVPALGVMMTLSLLVPLMS